MQQPACPNLNHRRADAPVRFCPACGRVVNAKMPQGQCPSVKHDASRRNHSVFCVDCGERLVAARP
jgi:hypothetical protein